MSDLEDEDILDDIKALRAVLTQNQSSVIPKKESIPKDLFTKDNDQCEPSTSQVSNNCYSPTNNSFSILAADDPLLDIEESEESECNDEEDNVNLSDPEAALNLNKKIISLLTAARRRLQLLLKECKRRQAVIDQKIHQRNVCPMSRILLTAAGIPYFKDKQHFPAPKNHDAKIKASRGELQIINLPCPLRWTLKDRNTLWEAIYSGAQAVSQEETKRKEITETSMALSNAEDPLKLDLKLRDKRIPEEMIQNFRNLVGPLGSKEFDWLKIAATDFNGRHSANECRAMWHVFLHPDINKSKWKKIEDENLKMLADEFNFQNWDIIADRLNTNRTGYQCFIRFNTNFRNNMFNRISSWSKEEDQKLTDTINALRTGNFIPWGEVAKLMGQRRKQQIYMRWNYSLAPNLKKGRFTEDEDKLLLEGVKKYGSNFTKISLSLLPHRTTAQLNDHYRTLMNEKKNDWSYDDDTKLLQLVEKYGNNWSVIAKKFANKSRVQVRHRHTAIIRYRNRSHSVTTLPKWEQKIELNRPEDILADGEQMLNEMSQLITKPMVKGVEDKEQQSDIDVELKDYFKGIYKTNSRRGRIKKFYNLEELEEKTQKLYVILRMLNADLDIPDDFEDAINLTEKDKQLLTSLKEYAKSEGLISFDTKRILIESTRQKMFGSQPSSANEEHFIPPLPFGGKVQRTKRKKLIGINYIPDGDTRLVELIKEFQVSEAIIPLIGGWDIQTQFQKVAEKLIEETKTSRDFSCSEKLVDRLKPLPSETYFFPEMNKNSNDTVNIDPHIPSTSALVSNKRADITTQQSISDTTSQKFKKYYPEISIPPNYTTLLAFRGILLSKHILEMEDPADDEDEREHKHLECLITPEGQKALELFEERLTKLFKFPIELSEVAPPLIHGVRDKYFFDDDDNCEKKRKRDKDYPGSKAKKKTKCEKVNDTEISES